MSTKALQLEVVIDRFPLKSPFRITGHTLLSADVVTVTLRDGLLYGRGEASGVYYREKEDISDLVAQIEALRPVIEHGVSRQSLQQLLPAGGARNALDCALWDLEAKQRGIPAWQIADLESPRALLTTFTCGADDPEKMAETALSYRGAKAIKLKLTGEVADADRVIKARKARPDVWMCVDGNQGFTMESLARLIPVLVDADIRLIEQPFSISQDVLLDQLECPIPLAADESIQDLADLAAQVGRVQVVNIKLDKCGGLTAGLAMAREARRLGFGVMVGNMNGTSLAMAPSFLVGQLCQIVDLDGPIFLDTDRRCPVEYEDGMVNCPPNLWGGAVSG